MNILISIISIVLIGILLLVKCEIWEKRIAICICILTSLKYLLWMFPKLSGIRMMISNVQIIAILSCLVFILVFEVRRKGSALWRRGLGILILLLLMAKKILLHNVSPDIAYFVGLHKNIDYLEAKSLVAEDINFIELVAILLLVILVLSSRRSMDDKAA